MQEEQKFSITLNYTVSSTPISAIFFFFSKNKRHFKLLNGNRFSPWGPWGLCLSTDKRVVPLRRHLARVKDAWAGPTPTVRNKLMFPNPAGWPPVSRGSNVGWHAATISDANPLHKRTWLQENDLSILAQFCTESKMQAQCLLPLLLLLLYLFKNHQRRLEK